MNLIFEGEYMKTYVELETGLGIMRGFENVRKQSACLVMFHGFTGNKMETNRMFLNIDRVLKERGISSLRFDWYGHGESDLDFSSLESNILLNQGQAILDYAKGKYEKVYLLGFSMGGAIAINLLKSQPDQLILISPAINMYDILSKIYKSNLKIGADFVDLNGLKLSNKFVESFKTVSYKDHLNQYPKPVLLIHGTHDQSVPIDLSRSLSKNIQNLKYLEIQGANHGYASFEYMKKITQAIESFLL